MGNKVALGFAEARLQAGTHICQIYGSEDERASSVFEFLLQGIADREACACFSDKTRAENLRAPFAEQGHDLAAIQTSRALTLAGATDTYFQGGEFDPQRMLRALREFHDHARQSGYAGARVIGEMSPEIHRVPGGSRLLEYESRVSLQLRQYPVTAMCQYDANDFDGATIMDVLKVHPLMVVRGAVVANPFFVPPEEFLEALS